MVLDVVPVRTSRGWSFSWDNQWPAVFRPSKHSWTDFSLIRIEVEHERAMDNWSASLALLGFTCYVSYCYYEGSPETAGDKHG
jgi:hypothetical protein